MLQASPFRLFLVGRLFVLPVVDQFAHDESHDGYLIDLTTQGDEDGDGFGIGRGRKQVAIPQGGQGDKSEVVAVDDSVVQQGGRKGESLLIEQGNDADDQ